MKKQMKGFTLIELIAVLVIMAIIALIVTPLVMSIIRKAKVSADKRSIDAYGRSIELAIAGYLLDNGTFPTSIEQLTIEYSGDEVACSTTQLNPDSSVYLSGCTVGGRSVDGYTYGKEETITYNEYSVGDEVTYNNINYYVIKDSGAKESTVTLLKAEPLTVAEVNTYGAGHVNMYACRSSSGSCYQTAYNNNGYGGIAYYSSETCGFDSNNNWQVSGCTTNYATSEVKFVVDTWKNAQAPEASEARLVTLDDLTNNLGYVLDTSASGEVYIPSSSTPNWTYNSNYWYWTMSAYQDSSSHARGVFSTGEVLASFINDGSGSTSGRNSSGVVRPTIVLSKSVLQ